MGTDGGCILFEDDTDFSGINYDTRCWGTRIHIWNIADDSRLHVSNVLLNGSKPETESVNNNWHGPTGRYTNGVAADYYGYNGWAASSAKYGGNDFYNQGVFRIMGSVRGFTKLYHEYDTSGRWMVYQPSGGGSPLDQINAQGYLTTYDNVSALAEVDISKHAGLEGVSGIYESAWGRGMPGTSGVPGRIQQDNYVAGTANNFLQVFRTLHPAIPFVPLHMGWQGYLRNWVDESAVGLFANAKHGANKKVNLLSIYRSVTELNGGEGRDGATDPTYVDYLTYGPGVRSLNLFSLDRLL